MFCYKDDVFKSCSLLKGVFLKNASQSRDRCSPGMLHHCVFSLNLALGAFQNFMGQGSKVVKIRFLAHFLYIVHKFK